MKWAKGENAEECGGGGGMNREGGRGCCRGGGRVLKEGGWRGEAVTGEAASSECVQW